MTQFGLGLGYSANLLQKYNINADLLPKNGLVGNLAKTFSKISESGLFKSFSSLSYQVNMLDNMAKSPATLLFNPPTNNIAGNLIKSNILPQANNTMFTQLPTTPMINSNTGIGNICNKAIGFNNNLFSSVNDVRNTIYGKISNVGNSLFSKLGSSALGQTAKTAFGAVKGFGGKLIGKLAGTAIGKAAGAVGGKLLGVAAAALNFIPGIGTIASLALTIFGGKIFKGIGNVVKNVVGGIAKGVCNVAKKVGKFLKKL